MITKTEKKEKDKRYSINVIVNKIVFSRNILGLNPVIEIL